MFVNYNRRLKDRYEEKCLRNDFDPIVVEDLNWSSEWMTGEDGPSNEFVYGEEGLTWASIEVAMGVNEPIGPSTRNRRGAEVEEDVEQAP